MVSIKLLYLLLDVEGCNKRRDSQCTAMSHPIRVAAMVPERLRNIALVHDLLEDHPVLSGDLEEILSTRDFELLKILSRGTESYASYVSGILDDFDACVIKLADMCDNLSDKPIASQTERYLSWMPQLVEAVIRDLDRPAPS